MASENPIGFPPFAPFFTPSAREGVKDGSFDFLVRGDLQTESQPDLRPVNTVAPVIAGTPQVDEDLTATPGTWDDADSVAAQWLRDGVAIVGETSTTYTLVEDDIGANITYRETATNTAGNRK